MPSRGRAAKGTSPASGAHCLAGLDGIAAARDWASSMRESAASAKTSDRIDVILVVDTVQATLELDEILKELRDFRTALRLCPSGYLFSYIKTFSERSECVLPDRADMTPTTHCLRSYARHVHEIAQRRGVPILDDTAPLDDSPFAGDERVVAADLLQVPRGRITEQGVRGNIKTALQHLAGIGTGHATDAELARAQLWQWVHHDTGVLDSGGIINAALVEKWLAEELEQLTLALQEDGPPAAALQQAAQQLIEATRADEIAPFLTPEAYRSAE